METLYYGIDLHSTQMTNHLIKKEGGVTTERINEKIYTNEIKEKLFPKLTKETYVCVEASTGTFKFANMIKDFVKQVVVINPIDFKALYCSGKKTDKIDSKKLANKLKYFIESKDGDEDFPEVYVPKDFVISLRKLFSSYNLLKSNKISLINRIHSIFKSNLIYYKAEDLFELVEKVFKDERIDEVDKFQIDLLKSEVESLEKKINEIKKKILEIGYKYFEEEIKLLISVKGVSDFTACAVMADVADVTRFKNAKKFCSYLRSAPRVDSTNRTTKIGKINKKGRKLAFELILQGLNHIIKSTPRFEEFYDRKTKGKSKNKVRSAIVRKTFVSVYYMLKNKEIYRECDKKKYTMKLKEFEKNKKIFSQIV